MAIGLVFIASGFLKALDPEGFTATVVGYGILPAAAAPLAARALLPLEAALGAALLVDYRRRWGVSVAVILLAGFVGLLGYTWATGGDVASCGCFGRFADRTPLETLGEDIGFMAIALLGLLAPARAAAGGKARGALTAGTAVAALLLALAAPSLPLDDLVTKLKPGATVEDLHLTLPDTAISDGRHLVALLSLAQEDVSGPAVEALNQLSASPGAPAVAVLYPDKEEVKDAFFWSWAPAFPMYRVGADEMRALYRRLPRYFLVENGVVKRVWNIMPEADVLITNARAEAHRR